jgi:peptide/nickel transport system substrate-binding protein
MPVSRRQFLAGVAGSTATGALLAACGSSSPAAVTSRPGPPSRGGNLRIGLISGSSSDTLDPHNGLNYLDTARAVALYDPLAKLDPATTNIDYALAEEITPVNANGTEWVIRLRPGVTFHNSKPLTAQDVIFTFQRIIKNNYSGTSALHPVDLNGLKAKDSRTVLVRMSRPNTTFVTQLASVLTCRIVPDGYDAKARPNGTGAFEYHSFTPGQRSVFTRNAHYWQSPLPYADTLTITDFPDTVSLTDAIRTNAVDAIGLLDGPSFATLANVSGVNTVASKGGTIIPFTMRVDQEPFRDVRVRQALRLAVDRPQLIDSALDGYGTGASDVFSPFDPDFDHALIRRTDIGQARSLLKQAGQENLHVQLVTAPIAIGTVAMATVLAEQLKVAGVTLSLRSVDSGILFGTEYLSWPFAQDFYSYAPYLAQVSLCMLATSPWNETHNDNARYTFLYNQANATLNASLHKEIAYEMQQYDFTEGGFIIPAFVDALDAYSNKVTGYTTNRIGQPVNDLNFAALGFCERDCRTPPTPI